MTSSSRCPSHSSAAAAVCSGGPVMSTRAAFACRSRRTVASFKPVSFATSPTETRWLRSRSTAAAAASSAAFTARSASARASHASSTSTVASSRRYSRASWSGSSRNRRSRAASSLRARTRSRPACACAAVLTGDHLFLRPEATATSPRRLHKPKQRRPPSIGHRAPTLLTRRRGHQRRRCSPPRREPPHLPRTSCTVGLTMAPVAE